MSVLLSAFGRLSPEQLARRYYDEALAAAAENVSTLYRLDALDWAVLALYFSILALLSVYGAYRVRQVVDFWRYRRLAPTPKRLFADAELPRVTVQLPLFNEVYVVERLLAAVSALDYPRDRFEVQVLDDSTDETQAAARAAVERLRREGFDASYVHRDDRTGFKAGALENGLRTAKGELVAIFDADFVPRPDALRKLVHFFTDPLVACAQMRWSHINGAYNLLTRLQTVLLDGHFVVEQTVRNRTGGFFNFNGTAGIWRRRAIELSGGWQHDTLTEDTDLSFRAQLMGWRFVYLLDEDAPSEVPVEAAAFKAQQRRWAKGVTEVGLKLYPRIFAARLPRRVKAEMFFRLTGNVSYPLMILVSLLQFPLLVVRYQQGFLNLLLFDVPLLCFSTLSVALFYGTAVLHLDAGRPRRLLYLPMVMALGVGLALSNARAVVEALVGHKTEFVRTPKYRVEGARDDGWKRRKKYRRSRSLLPAVELLFALYFLLAILYAAHMGMWGTIPFISLFLIGYGYMGLASLTQALPLRRFSGLPHPPR
jgi:cellulose synthase/poly-beta-1,6-N-acetylglucosamine synthase-like glycosyltransferase